MFTFLIQDFNQAILLKSCHKFDYRLGVGDRYLFTVPSARAEEFRQAVCHHGFICDEIH